MTLNAVFAALHFLALGIGLGSVFMRGLYLRRMQKGESQAVHAMLTADNFWALAGLLWLGTGLMRAFGGLEKGTQWYLQNPTFHLKIGLFVFLLVLELVPVFTFVRWRVAMKKRAFYVPPSLTRLIRINDLETILVIVIVFVASFMARGL